MKAEEIKDKEIELENKYSNLNQLVGKYFYDEFESVQAVIKVDSVEIERKFGVENYLLKGSVTSVKEFKGEEISLNRTKVYKIASACIGELKEITLEEYNKKKSEFIDRFSKFN